MSKSGSPCYGRVIIINALCTAAAAGIATSQGAPILSTALFITALMLLCNEAWYRAAALPALVVALIGQLRKNCGEKQEKRDRMALRLSSCVLLLVPHLIFGILYGADTLTQGKASAELGICISHAVFACAFAAPALLWLIAQVGTDTRHHAQTDGRQAPDERSPQHQQPEGTPMRLLPHTQWSADLPAIETTPGTT